MEKLRWTSLCLLLVIFLSGLDLCFGNEVCSSPLHHNSHQEDHHHGHHHHHHHHHGCNHGHNEEEEESPREIRSRLLPEELAEDEDMKLYGFGYYHNHDHDHDHGHDVKLSALGVWLHALGCSLLVSLASLICLIFLPIIFVKGKPSKAVVDSLALFGAGAMLGDAFLHQLPHAFGGEHSHSHDHSHDHHGEHSHHDHSVQEHLPSHSHSLKDLSVGLAVLAGIVLFLLVEKLVRYVEDNSGGASGLSHGHHHHHFRSTKKLKDDKSTHDEMQSKSASGKEEKLSDEISDDSSNGDTSTQHEPRLRKRKTGKGGKGNTVKGGKGNKQDTDSKVVPPTSFESSNEEEPAQPTSNLVFGYLNLFSDGVHNFTDGMALGSAFLLYGSVGGWSRTLFLLAHELPQEIGDFGILVRSGFSASKALFFNFLSALVALAGTTVALLWGKDPGQSSLIEGFTAGGFIYIAVAGVLAEMNNTKPTLRSTAVHVTSLVLGMGIALCISLVE